MIVLMNRLSIPITWFTPWINVDTSWNGWSRTCFLSFFLWLFHFLIFLSHFLIVFSLIQNASIVISFIQSPLPVINLYRWQTHVNLNGYVLKGGSFLFTYIILIGKLLWEWSIWEKNYFSEIILWKWKTKKKWERKRMKKGGERRSNLVICDYWFNLKKDHSFCRPLSETFNYCIYKFNNWFNYLVEK